MTPKYWTLSLALGAKKILKLETHLTLQWSVGLRIKVRSDTFGAKV